MYPIIYFLALVLLDSFLWGYCYEQKMLKLNTNKGFFNLKVFDSISNLIKPITSFLFSKVIIYRIFQKILEISGLVAIYFLTGSFTPIVGLILAHYFMSFDFGYYVVLNQFGLLKESHAHLIKWYTLGGLVFKTDSETFNTKLFVIFGLMGILILTLFATIL